MKFAIKLLCNVQLNWLKANQNEALSALSYSTTNTNKNYFEFLVEK